MKKVLVVCTGNICRSPMGEIVLAAAAKERGVELELDSAGVSSEEEGNPIDSRARATLQDAGYAIPSTRARKVRPGELGGYDLVLAMTAQHQSALRRRAELDGVPSENIRLWREFDPSAPRLSDGVRPSALDVPDPWYGTRGGFVETLELVESAVDGILEELSD